MFGLPVALNSCGVDAEYRGEDVVAGGVPDEGAVGRTQRPAQLGLYLDHGL